MKLLTRGKGVYPYSLCNDAYLMKKKLTFGQMELVLLTNKQI